MTVSAYPLSWPPSFPRAKSRERGKFQTTLAGALKNVEDSLRRFGADSGKKIDSLVMSSNVTLGATRPDDPGVAVWFTWDGLGVCIAVDRYVTVEANLQAIHKIIEARAAWSCVTAHWHWSEPRSKASSRCRRRGGRTGQTCCRCRRTRSERDVKAAYRRLASQAHPDKPGGSHERMAALNAAQEQALQECIT